jgi:signal transduction histidine kinase
MAQRTLGRRLYLLHGQWFALVTLTALLVATFAFARLRDMLLADRLLLARTTAQAFDAAIETGLQGMAHVASELGTPIGGAGSAGRELRSLRFQGLFHEAVYLLDADGRVLEADPPGAAVLPLSALPTKQAVTRRLIGADGRGRLLIAQPLRRADQPVTLVAQQLTHGSDLNSALRRMAGDSSLLLFMVDDSGAVIAAADETWLDRSAARPAVIAGLIARREASVDRDQPCIVCAASAGTAAYVTAVAPLRLAPWAVVVQQAPADAFASLYAIQALLAVAAALVAVTGWVLTRAISRSIVEPIAALSARAAELQAGDLETPIAVAGDREVELLATALDAARQRLGATLGELRELNDGLESLVAERTQDLRRQVRQLALLHAVGQASLRDRDPAAFVPAVLRLASEYLSFHTVALALDEPAGGRHLWTQPAGVVLSWLTAGETPPSGWQRRDLIYEGQRLGQLLYRWQAQEDERAMSALADQLALALHDAQLVARVLTEDAQRKVLVRRLLGAGEEERRRIARELHDEISQLLTVIQLSLDRLADDPQGIERSRRHLAAAQTELHRIIYDLRPSVLDDLGLASALQWYAENVLGRAGIAVNLDIEPDLALPGEAEITAFRIYQEIVTNIVRHSGAENVSIELYARDGQLVLAVEDDGSGFDPGAKADGAGILGMRERAELVGGSLTFDSQPGSGTQVLLQIPLSP